MAEVSPISRGEQADLSALQAQINTINAMLPLAATFAPPPVAMDGTIGSELSFARADHTHESRLKARRIQITPDAQGRFVYTFPRPYPAGVLPVVTVTAESIAGAATRNDASVVQDTTTNTQTTILVTKMPTSITATVLGGVIPILTPQNAPVWVNVMSRAPS